MTAHAALDGAMIASGFSMGGGLGVILVLVAVMHKLPEGAAIASIQIGAGKGRTKGFLSGVVLGGSTIIGACAMANFTDLIPIVLPLATGAMIYVAASDLVPILIKTKSMHSPGAILLGAGVFVLTDFVIRWLVMSGAPYGFRLGQ